jgi:hypothetical protein
MAMAEPEPNETPASPKGDENSIRPSKKRRLAGNAEVPASRAAAPANASAKPAYAVPEEVRRRFVVVKNKYYFHDGTRAFTDRGTRLTTPSENSEVVRSLIEIAHARGWTEITVRGTERFRQEAWFAGHLAGLEVRGYRPSEFEQGRLARSLAREAPPPTEDSVTRGEAPAAAADPRRPAHEELLTGRLVDHGRSTYQHDPRHAMSYFVKLETARGERTVWGVDLERAIKESLTKPDIGDEVGLRALRQEPVTVRTQDRDAAGEVIERELDTHRNHWIIERRGFFDGREEAAQVVRDTSLNPKDVARKNPQLVGTLLDVQLAKLVAKSIPHAEDREKFVAAIRSALADAIARGEPPPAVKLRERVPGRAPQAPERVSAPVRG